MTDGEFITNAPELRRLALRKASGFSLATGEKEDIAQETLLRLWSLRARVETANQAAALAARVAGRLAIDRLRARHTVPIDADKQAPSRSPHEQLEEKENDAWLERQLRSLPSTEYQVLRMRRVERKSAADIAAILGITKESVYTLLSNARRKMAEAFKQWTQNNPR